MTDLTIGYLTLGFSIVGLIAFLIAWFFVWNSQNALRQLRSAQRLRREEWLGSLSRYARGGAMHTSGVGGPVNFRVTSQQGNEERAELLTEELNRLIEAIPNASTYYGRIQPFNPTAGTFWVDTENNTLRIYDGTGWTHIAVLNTAINQPPYANAEVVSEERFTADETKRGRKLILED